MWYLINITETTSPSLPLLTGWAIWSDISAADAADTFAAGWADLDYQNAHAGHRISVTVTEAKESRELGDIVAVPGAVPAQFNVIVPTRD